MAHEPCAIYTCLPTLNLTLSLLPTPRTDQPAAGGRSAPVPASASRGALNPQALRTPPEHKAGGARQCGAGARGRAARAHGAVAGSAGVRERGSERLRAAAIGCSVGPGEQQEPVKRRHTAEAAEDGVCVLLACCYGCRTACIPILRYLLVVRVPATCSLHLLLRAFVLLFACSLPTS